MPLFIYCITMTSEINGNALVQRVNLANVEEKANILIAANRKNYLLLNQIDYFYQRETHQLWVGDLGGRQHHLKATLEHFDRFVKYTELHEDTSTDDVRAYAEYLANHCIQLRKEIELFLLITGQNTNIQE